MRFTASRDWEEPACAVHFRARDAIEFLKWALRAEPGESVVMGGTLHGSGNVAPHSEFNFFVDPVAARQVIRSGATMTLIPLDATRMIDLSREEIQQQRQNNPSAAAVFCEEATRVGLATAERRLANRCATCTIRWPRPPSSTIRRVTTNSTGSMSRQRVS